MSTRTRNKLQTCCFPSILNDTPFAFVETFNSLRTNIQFASVNNKYQKIMITSSVPKEGKSTVAINLAIALANAYSRVLLIDCDLRDPDLKRFLQIDSEASGLTTAIAEIKNIEQCIVHLDDMGVDVIPSGTIPTNPAELLGSDKMLEIIETLSKRYDYILFDTPPVSEVTDAAVISKLCDGVVFVVKHYQTAIGTAQLAISSLESVGATVIGTVLNAFDAKKSINVYADYHYKQHKYASQNKLSPHANVPAQTKAF